jgi:predicted SnoaL-like aldol condensation-catalyzing enzyme
METTVTTIESGKNILPRKMKKALISLVLGVSLAVMALLSGLGMTSAHAATSERVLPTGAQCTGIEQRNKEIVQYIYNVIYNQDKVALVDKVFSADLIQHDPTLANGRQGERAYIQNKLAQKPRPVFVVKHLLAYGDIVAAHVQVTTTPGNEFSGQAELDLFRLNQQGQIVEHWDSIQNVPAKSTSGNSMFSTLYHDGRIPVTAKQEDANRALVSSLADRLFNKRDLSVLDQYWSPTYIQHNPQMANGVSGLKAALPTFFPFIAHFNIDYAVADGNYVLLFQQSIAPGQNINNQFAGAAIADLYHVVNGKVVEHWDIIQNVPTKSVNGHSMFSSLYNG